MITSSHLSWREKEVVELLLLGKSNKQIATTLNITVRTVEFHLSNIYKKIGVFSRSEAILKLAEIQLRETTGKEGKGELRESTVETGQEAVDNAKQPILRRVPMKPLLFFSVVLAPALVVFFILSGNAIDFRPDIHSVEEIAQEATAISYQTVYASPTGPFLLVSTNANFVIAYNWPVGNLVTLTIDDPSNGAGVDYTDIGVSVNYGQPGLPTQAVFHLVNPMNIKPGFIVNATDGISSRSLVTANFFVTSIDQDTNTISGTGTPGVTVQICGEGQQAGDCRYAIVDNDGKWSAPPYSPNTFILKPGLNGWAIESDNDGDQTYNHWQVLAIIFLPTVIR